MRTATLLLVSVVLVLISGDSFAQDTSHADALTVLTPAGEPYVTTQTIVDGTVVIRGSRDNHCWSLKYPVDGGQMLVSSQVVDGIRHTVYTPSGWISGCHMECTDVWPGATANLAGGPEDPDCILGCPPGVSSCACQSCTMVCVWWWPRIPFFEINLN